MNDPLTQDLRTLNRIAKKMRKERFARGALTLSVRPYPPPLLRGSRSP